MTSLLATCYWLAMGLSVATGLLLLVPPARVELRLWRRLRVQSLRRWLTRKRRVDEPLEPQITRRIARRNLLWHLVLTGLFASQLLAAAHSEGRWWRPLAAPLIVPCIAYFAGSLVQRQKLALLRFCGASRLRAAGNAAPPPPPSR